MPVQVYTKIVSGSKLVQKGEGKRRTTTHDRNFPFVIPMSRIQMEGNAQHATNRCTIDGNQGGLLRSARLKLIEKGVSPPAHHSTDRTHIPQHRWPMPHCPRKKPATQANSANKLNRSTSLAYQETCMSTTKHTSTSSSTQFTIQEHLRNTWQA